MQVVSSSRRGFALALLVALAAFGAAPSRAAPPVAKPLARSPAPQPAEGLIVALKDAPGREQALALRPTEERLRQIASAAHAPPRRLRALGGGAYLLDFGRRLQPAEAAGIAAAMKARAEVQWVVPNVRERRLALPTPNDPLFPQQWWLEPVRGANGNVIADRLRGVPGFQTAWAVNTGSPNAVVAVLDTGITVEPELAGRVLPGYDFVSGSAFDNDPDPGPDADPSDPGDWVSQADVDNDPSHFSGCTVENSSWHGTNISGLIAAATNNGIGVAGINWNGAILPVRVAGKCGALASDIIAGINWAAGIGVPGVPDNPHPARIINISFGGTDPCDGPYQAAIDAAAAAGAVVVAAAGNERQIGLTRPASCDGVVAVGAVNRDGFKTNYSNFGSVAPHSLLLMTVGGDPSEDGRWGSILGDPGLETIDNEGTTSPVTPTDPGQQVYARLFGTSFSTPLVSGAISLMLSVNPNLTRDQIIDGLRKSARPHVQAPKIGTCSQSNPGRCICTQATCGAGLLDAAEALRYAQGPGSYVAPNWPLVVIDNADIDRAVALGPDEDGSAPAPTPAPSGGDSGGGALDGATLLALALAVLFSAATRPRPARWPRSSRR